MADKKHKFDHSKPIPNYLDLFYMTPSEVRAKDIAGLLHECGDFTLELWDEMNILELELMNKNTVDLEPIDINFKDPSDAAFVKNRRIHTIFAVHLSEEDLTTVQALFKEVINQYSGFLCSDSTDFKPVYVGSAEKA